MKECAIDGERAVVPHDQAPEVSEPGVGAFDNPSPAVAPQGSAILRSMSLANCLIDLPVGPSRIEKGELVDVILTEQPPV